jgi:LysM repeat protein
VQTLKTLLIVAVLSAVAYGVYVALTGTPDAGPPPGASDEGYDAAPTVELPAAKAGRSGETGSSAVSTAAPSSLGEAPPYIPQAPARDSDSAPPYVPPQVGPQPHGAVGNLPPGAYPEAAPDAGNLDTRYPPSGLSPEPAAGIPADASPRVLGAASAGNSPTSYAPAVTGDAHAEFAAEFRAAQALLDQGKMDEALRALSRWYDDARLSSAEQESLLEMLNQLAGTVIYSKEHLLEPAYEVQPGDTLDRIGEMYKVPYQLLAKINAIEDPFRLRVGEKLKVVPGPFDAVVDLKKKQLTLVLNGRYAGRFPVGVGADQSTPEGELTVQNKITNPTYYGPERTIDADDPANPLGERWIDLGNRLGIHGTNDAASIGAAESRGCIRLSAKDVEDVYDILSVGSHVIVRR